MNIARSSIKLFSTQTIVATLGITGIVIFARQLTPTQLGVFFLFQALFTVLTDVADLGINTAVEKRISEGQQSDAVLGTATVLRTIVLAAVVLGIIALRRRINQYIGADFAIFLLITVVIATFGNLMLAVLRGELRVGDTAEMPLLNQILWIGVGVGLLAAGFGTEALVYAVLTGQVAVLFWGGYRIATSVGRPTRAHAHSLLGYAKFDFIGSMSWQMHNWMDVVVIGWFLSQAAVGTYEIAWRVASVVTILSTAISMSVLPQVSAWDAEAATDRIEQLFYDSLTPALLLVIPAVFGVAVLAREILGLLFGPEYTVAWLVLIVLTAGKVAEGVKSITSKCLHGIDRPDLVARATIVAGVLNVVLNVVLVQQVGIVGAAAATVVSYGVGTGMRIRYLSDLITVRIPYGELGWCVLSALVMTGVVLSIRMAFIIDTPLRLAAIVAAAAIVYTIVILTSENLRQRAVRTIRGL